MVALFEFEVILGPAAQQVQLREATVCRKGLVCLAGWKGADRLWLQTATMTQAASCSFHKPS